MTGAMAGRQGQVASSSSLLQLEPPRQPGIRGCARRNSTTQREEEVLSSGVAFCHCIDGYDEHFQVSFIHPLHQQQCLTEGSKLWGGLNCLEVVAGDRSYSFKDVAIATLPTCHTPVHDDDCQTLHLQNVE